MATGDTIGVFTAAAGTPPTSSPAQYSVTSVTPVWAFDASSDENVEFVSMMPSHYAASTGITARIAWTSDTATSGACVWSVSFKSMTDDTDSLSKAYATAQTVSATAPSAAGEVVYDTIDFSHAQADSIATGEVYKMNVMRDVDPSDNMLGDAHLISVELQDRGG